MIWLLPALALAVTAARPVAATGPRITPPSPAALATPAAPATLATPAAPTPTSAPARSGPIILVAATPTPAARPLPTPRRSALVAALSLPGVSEPVVVTQPQAEPVGEGVVQWAVPRYDAGQHNTTPACGQPGNTIIVGHSVWYDDSGVFAPLLAVEPGQFIRCKNDDGREYVYQVQRKWEAPYEDGSWLSQAQTDDLLTLYTCRLDLTGLVIVQAQRIDG